MNGITKLMLLLLTDSGYLKYNFKFLICGGSTCLFSQRGFSDSLRSEGQGNVCGK